MAAATAMKTARPTTPSPALHRPWSWVATVAGGIVAEVVTISVVSTALKRLSSGAKTFA
jgi:hypothetical protein